MTEDDLTPQDVERVMRKVIEALERPADDATMEGSSPEEPPR
jgi:hypothetical protein